MTDVIRIGFTGTKRGMTSLQNDKLAELINQFRRPIEAHHGDCIGADAGFHDIIYERIGAGTRIVIHPPINPTCRAFRGLKSNRHNFDLSPLPGVVILLEKEYVPRDRDIVDATEEMFAAPKGLEEIRSGTWTTVRYARKQGRRITIVWPNGNVTVEPARVSPQGELL